MSVFVSMLRGINVGGQKKILMKDLRSLYESLDFEDVQTVIQSGNVIFCSAGVEIADLTSLIEEKINQTYGFYVHAILRNADEMQRIVQSNPYFDKASGESRWLHVTFLSHSPTDDDLQKIMDLDFGADAFCVSGREIYLYCPGGSAKTKLTNTFFEKKLNVAATTRNWKTANKINHMVKSLR